MVSRIAQICTGLVWRIRLKNSGNLRSHENLYPQTYLSGKRQLNYTQGLQNGRKEKEGISHLVQESEVSLSDVCPKNLV